VRFRRPTEDSLSSNHPDKNPGDQEAIDRFKEAAEAFEILNDSDKRSRYDRYGHAGVNGRSGAHHFNDVEDIFSAFGDIFGDLFGGGRGRTQKGRDVRCDVTLTLHEAAAGVTRLSNSNATSSAVSAKAVAPLPVASARFARTAAGRAAVIQSAGIVRMQTTCPACHGEGSVVKNPCTSCRGTGQKLKKVVTEVEIPPGVDDEMRVRITGQGEPSPNGGQPGDCYCFISVLAHPLFERDGQHLVCRIPITLRTGSAGTTIEVPTLKGRGELEIPAGTQSGAVFRMGAKDARPTSPRAGGLVGASRNRSAQEIIQRGKSLLRDLAELEHKHVAPEAQGFFEKLKEYFTAEEDARK